MRIVRIGLINVFCDLFRYLCVCVYCKWSLGEVSVFTGFSIDLGLILYLVIFFLVYFGNSLFF